MIRRVPFRCRWINLFIRCFAPNSIIYLRKPTDHIVLESQLPNLYDCRRAMRQATWQATWQATGHHHPPRRIQARKVPGTCHRCLPDRAGLLGCLDTDHLDFSNSGQTDKMTWKLHRLRRCVAFSVVGLALVAPDKPVHAALTLIQLALSAGRAPPEHQICVALRSAFGYSISGDNPPYNRADQQPGSPWCSPRSATPSYLSRTRLAPERGHPSTVRGFTAQGDST
jgi:hypothetical protein